MNNPEAALLIHEALMFGVAEYLFKIPRISSDPEFVNAIMELCSEYFDELLEV